MIFATFPISPGDETPQLHMYRREVVVPESSVRCLPGSGYGRLMRYDPGFLLDDDLYRRNAPEALAVASTLPMRFHYPRKDVIIVPGEELVFREDGRIAEVALAQAIPWQRWLDGEGTHLAIGQDAAGQWRLVVALKQPIPVLGNDLTVVYGVGPGDDAQGMQLSPNENAPQRVTLRIVRSGVSRREEFVSAPDEETLALMSMLLPKRGAVPLQAGELFCYTLTVPAKQILAEATLRSRRQYILELSLPLRAGEKEPLTVSLPLSFVDEAP